MFYNWNRDFNPALGRYVQSDPTGLNAGINTYLYVQAGPLWLSDLRGLADSLHDSMAAAVARGDVQALNDLLMAGLEPAEQAAVQQAIRDATLNAAKQAAAAVSARRQGRPGRLSSLRMALKRA